MLGGERFLELACVRRAKHGQSVSGDVHVARRLPEEGRLVAVLSDGLGSGIKANVLATLTATMAGRFAAAGHDPERSAAAIMRTLPVCSRRGIGYATFTILEAHDHGACRLWWMGNPAPLVRGAAGARLLTGELIADAGVPGRTLRSASVELAIDEDLVTVSDGVVHAGMGSDALPLGWGEEGVRDALAARTANSAAGLAESIVAEALRLEAGATRDDASCMVCRLRHPRHLLVVTGPPYDRDEDAAFARRVADFTGTVVVCGGTTAAVIARQLDRQLELLPQAGAAAVPPASRMAGCALVTEGAVTLEHLRRLLGETSGGRGGRDAAAALRRILLDHDTIHFLVGSALNPAHHDPRLPRAFDLRWQQVDHLRELLERRHCKRVNVERC